jgi:ubiquinone/menaquinone biosynthesis C-methylase UbiE
VPIEYLLSPAATPLQQGPQFFPDQPGALREMRRVLKSEGIDLDTQDFDRKVRAFAAALLRGSAYAQLGQHGGVRRNGQAMLARQRHISVSLLTHVIGTPQK